MAHRPGAWRYWVFASLALAYILWQLGAAFGLWPFAPATHDPAGYPLPRSSVR